MVGYVMNEQRGYTEFILFEEFSLTFGERLGM